MIPCSPLPSLVSKSRLVVAMVATAAFGYAIAAPHPAAGDMSLYVLVNDDPISEFDIDQRVNMLMSSSSGMRERMEAKLRSKNINEQFRKFAEARNPQSQEDVKRLQGEFVETLRRQALKEVRPGLRSAALRELVNERLMLQEARRQSIVIDNDEIDKVLTGIAQRNNATLEQFAASLRKTGVNIQSMRERLRSQLSWSRLVRSKYGRDIFVDEAELDGTIAGLGDDQSGGGAAVAQKTELQLQRITLPLSGQIDQSQMGAQFANAEDLRRRFQSCSTTKKLAARAEGAKYEDLGRVKLDTLPVEARPILAAAQSGQMAPPVFTSSGIQLYAVCDRREVAGDDKARTDARDKMEQDQLASYAQRLLRDLCTDAFLEYKSGEQPSQKPCGEA